MSNCKARRYNEQWHCNSCGFQWDVKDDDPPTCLTEHDRHVKAMIELWKESPEVDRVSVKPVFVHGVGWV